ncbi:hypothetical protein D3C73_1245500 [compost metagenome]
MNWSGQFAGRRIVFLQHDAREIIVVLAEIPAHIEQPFAPVFIMEEERVEAAAVQADRAAPRPLKIRRRNQVIMQILVYAFAGFYVCKQQVE